MIGAGDIVARWRDVPSLLEAVFNLRFPIPPLHQPVMVLEAYSLPGHPDCSCLRLAGYPLPTGVHHNAANYRKLDKPGLAEDRRMPATVDAA